MIRARVNKSPLIAIHGANTMLLPAQYFWFEPVLLAAIIVFVVDLVGNTIFFGSRVVNALTTAVLFAALFGSLMYYGYGSVSVSFNTTPSLRSPSKAP